jgi:AcrR family transcriptional regulator
MTQTRAETPPKPATRERLLDTAERLFAERGFAGTSVRDITDEAGANLGAVNYYFQSKENLYAQVFRRRSSSQGELMLGAFRNPKASRAGGLESLLVAFGRAFMAPHTDPAYRPFLDLCSREMAEGQLPSGTFLRDFVTPVIETVVGLVRVGRPGMDEATATSCAHSFLAQLIHAVRGERVARKKSALPSLDERVAFIARFTAAAIRHI